MKELEADYQIRKWEAIRKLAEQGYPLDELLKNEKGGNMIKNKEAVMLEYKELLTKVINNKDAIIEALNNRIDGNNNKIYEWADLIELNHVFMSLRADLFGDDWGIDVTIPLLRFINRIYNNIDDSYYDTRNSFANILGVFRGTSRDNKEVEEIKKASMWLVEAEMEIARDKEFKSYVNDLAICGLDFVDDDDVYFAGDLEELLALLEATDE